MTIEQLIFKLKDMKAVAPAGKDTELVLYNSDNSVYFSISDVTFVYKPISTNKLFITPENIHPQTCILIE